MSPAQNLVPEEGDAIPGPAHLVAQFATNRHTAPGDGAGVAFPQGLARATSHRSPHRGTTGVTSRSLLHVLGC